MLEKRCLRLGVHLDSCIYRFFQITLYIIILSLFTQVITHGLYYRSFVGAPEKEHAHLESGLVNKIEEVVNTNLSSIAKKYGSDEDWAKAVDDKKNPFGKIAFLDYEGLENLQNPLSGFCSKTFWHTFHTTLKEHEFGVFVLTGDIPDMWIRDSAAQITPYVPYMNEVEAFHEVVIGVAKSQRQFILEDPYANSYSQKWRDPRKLSNYDQGLKRGNWVATYNYELDSGCYHIRLLYEIFGQIGELDEMFKESIWKLMRLWKLEQNHEEKSTYRYRELDRDGLGSMVGYTGLTWSAFRPSDDRQQYHYLVPSNMFAGAVLQYVQELGTYWKDSLMVDYAHDLQQEIKEGLEKFAIVEHSEFGKIYAYEVDGLGGQNLMDDANIPSLLSIPFIDPEGIMHDKSIYANTKKFILSTNNPYYYEGSAAKGIGSPHTPNSYIWHLSLIMEAYLLEDGTERYQKLKTILTTTDGTLHEGFYKNNYKQFTRSWFTWPDSLFAMGPWCEKFIKKDIKKVGMDLKVKYKQ